MSKKKHGMRRIAGYLVNHKLINWMPDKPYLQIFSYAVESNYPSNHKNR